MTDAIPLFQKEFPDFDPATLPSIPAGFEDVSWHNDSCPSFLNEAAGLIIFVDFANPAVRENPDTKRFCLNVWENGNTNESLAYSDDWQDILAAIDGRSKPEAKPDDPRRVVLNYNSDFLHGTRRYYFVSIACQIGADLLPLIMYAEGKGESVVTPQYTNRKEADRAVKAFAKASGLPLVDGLYRGYYGKPLKRVSN